MINQKSKLFSKRAEIGTMEKIITIIIVLVVLAVILLFIFKQDILQYFRNLPDYSPPQEDKNIESGPAEKILVSKTCPNIEIGYVRYDGRNSNIIYINNEKTFLFWKKSSGSIKLDERGDENVGEVDSQHIMHIYPKWINDLKLRKKHEKIPSREDLRKLDGATLSSDNKICR